MKKTLLISIGAVVVSTGVAMVVRKGIHAIAKAKAANDEQL